ncbi:MAG: YraN family protein [Flavobacteriales bacterium]|nr:YraN family protein [Flavobacteriales bacterium]MCB9194529.1 YraN family protein [Flavobacteriales bacterium]
MAEHLRIGQLGEQAACRFLEQAGYTILARNWRHGRDELDIVARQGDTVVMVEVKTRSDDRVAAPEEAVDKAKQDRLIRAAEAFIEQQSEEDLQVRFDVVTVLFQNGGTRIRHIPEAFYPTNDDR